MLGNTLKQLTSRTLIHFWLAARAINFIYLHSVYEPIFVTITCFGTKEGLIFIDMLGFCETHVMKENKKKKQKNFRRNIRYIEL